VWAGLIISGEMIERTLLSRLMKSA
jgi:hypothetical protein